MHTKHEIDIKPRQKHR